MKIELAGFLQAATGPYGGRAAGTKLVTLRDGQVLVTRRKTSMTGDHVLPIHAWSRLNWIMVDCLWQTLPRRIRAVWGMCARRTTDKSSSNLDEFRHVNMPRAILGMPLLRLPPDHAKSQGMYFPSQDVIGRRNRKKPTQLWVAGVQKPEPPWKPTPDEPDPPWPGPDPPPPQEFDTEVGPVPNLLSVSASCVACPCPDTVPHCYDLLYNKQPVDFVARPGHDYFLWKAWTNPERTVRSPVWDIQTEIWSERRWYDDEPWERVVAENVACYADTYEGRPLPFGSAYCVKFTHYSGPGMMLSYAYYWQFATELCPYPYFELAWATHVYGDYPWPASIDMAPSGDLLVEAPPCPDHYGVLLRPENPSGCWLDNTDLSMWAGWTWYMPGPHEAYPRPELCAGTANVNVGVIKCCDTEPRKGMWYFQVTVLHGGEPILLEYRKPLYRDDYGVFGTYFLHDPNGIFGWASFGVMLHNRQVDWYDFLPDEQWEAVKQLFIIALWELAGYGLMWYTRNAIARLEWRAGYRYEKIHDALKVADGLSDANRATTWKCRLGIQMGRGAMRNRTLALEAIRRFRAAALLH